LVLSLDYVTPVISRLPVLSENPIASLNRHFRIQPGAADATAQVRGGLWAFVYLVARFRKITPRARSVYTAVT